jgi:hypothetical protein
MKIVLFALGAWICFAQSPIHFQTNGPLAGGPSTANAGTGQPFPATVVTGKPFIAAAIVQTDQVLADGSHVVNQQTVAAARDGQGRTYREEIVGPPDGSNAALKTIFIGDPVAQVNYVLGPDHVARKTPMSMPVSQSGPGSQPGTVSVSTGTPPPGDLMLQRFRTAAGGGSGPVLSGSQSAQPAQQAALVDSKVEQLGSQIVADVQAHGTRTTLTIPAGEVGNQNPLVIVTERWYSKDLEATVLATRTDPRFGTLSYQFTNVQQTEQPASLFQLPSGYTVEEGQ